MTLPNSDIQPSPEKSPKDDAGIDRNVTLYQRASWGALGAMLPLAVRLAGESHVYEKTVVLGGPGLIDILFQALILILVGAAVAAAFQEERNRRNLLIFGISAPALINSWAAYGTASQTESNFRNLRSLGYTQNQSASPGSAVPTAEPKQPHSFFKLGFETSVFAADSNLPTFQHADPTTLQKLQNVFTGSFPNKDYFVVLGSFSSAEMAEMFRTRAIKSFPSARVEVYGPPAGYSTPLYSVVLSPNLLIEEAKSLLSHAAKAGYSSAYVWTFGLPLRGTPQCSMLQVKEHVMTQLSAGSDTIYMYILKQRLWHKDQYAEVYFFVNNPWNEEAIKSEVFNRRIRQISQNDYLELNVHDDESVPLPFIKTDATFSLNMHPVKDFAQVKICVN